MENLDLEMIKKNKEEIISLLNEIISEGSAPPYIVNKASKINKWQSVYQLFTGKLMDEIGMDRAEELLNESNKEIE